MPSNRPTQVPDGHPSMSTTDHPSRPDDRESGQVLVLFAMVVVVLMGFAALVLDVGRLRLAEQDLWNALDAGALAGVAVLPDDGARASTLAEQYLQDNYPGDPIANRTVSFRCLVGSVNGAPRLSDIPATCDPGPLPASVPLNAWTCNSRICTAVCEPSAGDKCNTIVVSGEVTVPYSFGRVVGVNEASTGTVTSAACKGACGAPPENPVDIVLIVDRTQSMNGVDTDNARSAAQSVRTMLKPSVQWLGFSMLGPSNTTGTCKTVPATSIGTANAPADLARWVPIGLTGLTWQGKSPHVTQDFTATSSNMDNAIKCYTNSSTGTDLRDPIPMAVYELNTYGRAGVKKGIIMMTDGQPNASTVSPSSNNYCSQANTSATNAKNANVEIFTVAFGLDGTNDVNCPDGSGTFYNKKASALVASMATNSAANLACGDPENNDGDHYFCVPKTAGASTDLSKAFQTATAQLIATSRLVHLP